MLKHEIEKVARLHTFTHTYYIYILTHISIHITILRQRRLLLLLLLLVCHNGVRFFDISTSKSGPSMVSFVHVDFQMCFAPQWRALFGHRNFQKRSDTEVLCAF